MLSVAVLLLCSLTANAQQLSNARAKTVLIIGDTIVIDSLSIVPGSETIFIDNIPAANTAYEMLYAEGKVVWKAPRPASAVTFNYRVFPLSFTARAQHKDPEKMAAAENPDENPFLFSSDDPNMDVILGENQLTKTGSISRGIAFGNNQDLSVNSTLNLQLSGKLTDNVSVLAAITDDNIPIQPEGNTQQLQDFDQVYIQLFGDAWQLTAGDFQLRSPDNHFLVYHKKAQGATGNMRLNLNPTEDGDLDPEKPRVLNLQASAAASRGKFARNMIQGVEGNQGPYRLRGAENETFIIVLSGTERVFIDGQLLTRGMENDYVIDYNTAEITFTPNQLITKDKRISVEFQYSDKNYVRSLFQTGGSYDTKKLRLYWNMYAEQDLKNQPTLQTLTDADKLLLASVGDSLDQAVSNAAVPVGEFTNDRILYTVVDSLGYDSVYIYTSVDDGALFQVSFTEVGTGNGDYIIDDFNALGRIYKWVAPDTALDGTLSRNGNYAPLLILTAPRRQQVYVLGGQYKFSERLETGIELAASNDDINTFSSLDAQDNTGYALHFYTTHNTPLSQKKDPWTFITKAEFEYTGANFNPIQRFRPVEFQRNWNIDNTALEGNNNLTAVTIGLQQKQIGHVRYSIESFMAGAAYEGWKNVLSTRYRKNGFLADVNGSWLFTDGTRTTNFLRHKALLQQTIKQFRVGFRDEHERNLFSFSGSDTLTAASYQFYDWQFFVGSADTSEIRWEVFYRQRTDQAAANNQLNQSTLAEWVGAEIDYNKNKNHRFRIHVSNRTLRITDSTLTNQKPENTLVGRLEYNMRAFKGAITSTTFYEVGTGLEQKREFVYVEVPAGQGIYTWVDYNDDGVKDLNEFEVAAFSDQATYIRVFTPSNVYVRTYSNQFSQTLRIQPSRVWRTKTGVRKLLSKVSTQSSFRADRKTSNNNPDEAYNPFFQNPNDSSLLSINSSLRQSVYLNRTDPKLGADYTWQQVTGKSLLTSGFESRSNTFHEGRLRWNMTRKYTLTMLGQIGERTNASDFLTGRNYAIDYHTSEIKFSYQPGAAFRASLIGNYTAKRNDGENSIDKAFIRNIGGEFRYNVIKKGSFIAQTNIISISYTGLTNTSLAFEMLDALQPGINYTWSLSWQRNISKFLILSLNYNGRKSEENRAIHTGGMSVRALF